jgi:UDP-glucuronate decarboxylase
MLDPDLNEIAEGIRDLAPELEGRHLLITGGRGFLGRYFTAALARLNVDVLGKPLTVTAVDNLITAGAEGGRVEPLPYTTFIRHDITQPLELDRPPDFILHAAGIASPYYYRAYPLETLDVAVTGTRRMLELARQTGARILFFSSSEIYGDPDPRAVPILESYRGNVSCQGPRACYDESKRLGETLCYIYHDRFGVFVCTVRPFNVYGPGMQESDYRVLPNFASRLKARLPLLVYGRGNQTRTFCYVSDAIVGFLRALLKGVPGEAYNIGNPEPEISMLELVKEIEAVLGRPVEYTLATYPDSYPADEPQRRCPDIRKARLQLGYQPRVTLREGLRRFLSWADEVYTGKP